MLRLRAPSFVVAGVVLGVWAMAGCKRTPAAPAGPPTKPTLRVLVVTSLAGALEPCGCVKDMLGGIDHAARLTESKKAGAPSLLVAAGPTLFKDPTLKEEERTQVVWKAEAIAESLKDMGLAAWTPGNNDWAAGDAELARLAQKTGAPLVAANLGGKSGGAEPFRVVEAGGQKIGIVGIASPLSSAAAPPGVKIEDPRAALEKAKKALDQEGARIKIALVALPRGEALRLVETLGGFQLVVVGKTVDKGEANDGPVPPMLLGESLVVQTPNHLQGVITVDFFVRGDDLRFQDGSGLALGEKRDALRRRLEELERRIGSAEQPDSGVSPADLAARKADRDTLKKELDALVAPALPENGSFFRYELDLVKESLGVNSEVSNRMKSYYRRVNEHNKTAFRDRKPAPVPEGKSGYLGAEKCAHCHESEFKFWNNTPHASAYLTLEQEDKQFNLDCVSCHVTGYDKPGGSTVTQVEGLKGIQCEVCHGPGAKHADAPADKALIAAAPEKTLCASECHHPPHVKSDWSAEAGFKIIVGPGHQKQK